MNRRTLITSCMLVLCLALLASDRYSRTMSAKNITGEISEKDFTVTMGAGMASGAGDEGASLRRIDTPIRLKIIDIDNVIGVISLPDALFMAAIVIASILGTYLGIRFFRDRIHTPKPLSAYEAAVKELAGTDPGRSQPGDGLKEIYYRISRILRDYLKEALSFGPAELTASEFLAMLDGAAGISPDIKDAAKGLIARCDLMKFSGDTATVDELRTHFDAAKNIIDSINTAMAPKENKG